MITYGAVAEGDGTSKLNEITGRDGVVLLHEGDEVVDRVVDAVVGREVGLDGGEEQHRAVRATTAVEHSTYTSVCATSSTKSRRLTQRDLGFER